MKMVHRDDLIRGGFAGLRETRLVMDPQAWGAHAEPGAQPGVGRFVYLADAKFLPRGETRMHPHHEVDVISVMVEGRISHQGSLQHGQELEPFDVQVQRAGGEGFRHNEINPDEAENRMLQLWVLPETPGEPAGYRVYRPEAGERLRVYGGAAGQDDTFAAQTIMEVARLGAGQALRQDSACLAYITTGAGSANGQAVREGHLLRGESLDYTAGEDSLVVLVYEEQH
jgi:hypothetical protein